MIADISFVRGAVIKTLAEKIDYIDSCIAALGPEGRLFVDKIQELDIKTKPKPENVPFQAYYDAGHNTFHCDEDISLPLLFNVRVHECAHAIQCAEVPDVVDAINNLTRPESGAVVSASDLIRFKRAAEINAHAIQGYFVSMAVKQTGDKSYITCLKEDASLASFAELQEELFDSGVEPADVKNEIAQCFSNLKLSVFRAIPFIRIRQETAYDLATIFSYADARTEDMECPRKNLAITGEIIDKTINAVSPLDETISSQLLTRLCSPLKMSPASRILSKALRLTIKP